ncbi:signal peptidase I [Ectothiorhodospiraceae bacterium BW-2]|nr:signal peptidase I [Ectothiorhodospiraceae bacterium BW-2]
MNFDFPAFLVLFTAMTGLIWLLDVKVWAPKRRQRSSATGQPLKEPALVEMSRSFFPVILIVLLIRSFVAEPFRIPSGSMMPTLLVGDFILVNKFAYGIRLPVLNQKIIDIGDPKVGDIIVFRYPEDPTIDYIKRVVGVAGDRVAYRNKQLYVNGELLPQESLGRYIGRGGGAMMTGAWHQREMINGKEHDILVMPSPPIFNFETVVPADSYFVMGDNRDNSRDSRFWGVVPDENLIGKAFMIWMNWDSASDDIINIKRIGKWVD